MGDRDSFTRRGLFNFLATTTLGSIQSPVRLDADYIVHFIWRKKLYVHIATFVKFRALKRLNVGL